MNIQNLKTTAVSEIVNQNPGSVKVFEKFNIDYCCNGKLSFEEACRRANVSEESVKEALSGSVTDEHSVSIRVQDWPLDLLVNYIVKNHHVYIKKVTPEILFLLNKVATVHGANHPELHEIKHQFETLSAELETHMHKEEVILFPAVEDLVKDDNYLAPGQKNRSRLGFKLIYPIGVMEQEHELAGECLSAIRKFSNDYTLPAEACNSYTLLYKRLKEFEADLHTHIHLENNVLFPKALELEKRLEGELVE